MFWRTAVESEFIILNGNYEVLYDLSKLLAYSYKTMFSTETIERLLKVIPHNEAYSSPIKGLVIREP